MGSIKIFKIAVLLNNLVCSVYLNQTIKELSSHKEIELYLILAHQKIESASRILKMYKSINRNGFKRTIEKILFRLWVKFETRILGFFQPDFRKHLRCAKIDPGIFQGTVTITPIFSTSNPYCHYNKRDIENIKSLALDAVVCGNGQGLLTDEIAKSSRCGAISFHHGDSRWNRGGPPAFWEAYKRTPTTGFFIKVHAGSLRGEKVLFRGGVPTSPIYSRNLRTLKKESNPFVSKVVIEFLRGTSAFREDVHAPFSEPILEPPSISNLCGYVWGLTTLLSIHLLRSKVLRKQPRWSIGYIRGNWQEAELCKGVVVENPRNRFFADPFVTSVEGDHYIFVEDFDYRIQRGSISCIKISQGDELEIIRDVIKEDFHLSFPFLLEEQDKLYMIPEAHQSESIRLYECVEFPDKWRLRKELLTGVSAADTIVFKWGEQWIMLTNKNEFRTSRDHSSQLYAYCAESLLSDNWVPLLDGGLPIIFDPLVARNGGLLRDNIGNIYRVRQAQVGPRYGARFSIARIKKVETNVYEEEFLCWVNPHFLPKLLGCHHMHSNGLITVYDFAERCTIR